MCRVDVLHFKVDHRRTEVHAFLILAAVFPLMHTHTDTLCNAETLTGCQEHLINSVRQPRPTLPLCCRALNFGAKYTCAGGRHGGRRDTEAISSRRDPLW